MAAVEQLKPTATRVLWSPTMANYFFGDYHPMHPSRLDATAALAQDLGIFDLGQVQVEEPQLASVDQLALAHDPTYIRAVQQVSADPSAVVADCGLGTEDTPGYRGIHEASARLVGASLQAAEAVLGGEVQHAVNFGGGMHHASRDRASGFCVYNDCAVAISHLLEQGVNRLAYIDVDAHHGDGTQSIFWEDSRVMTLSIHETGVSLFPGTGFASEVGAPGPAAGTAVNIAMPATTTDSGWLRAFNAVVPSLLREFSPEVIVSQHGCDSHMHDDMSHLRISINAQQEIAAQISLLADELCEGRWIATGGGGYSVYDAVPRSWAHLIAVAAGAPIDVHRQTPASWQRYMLEKYGAKVPAMMGDPVDLWWRSWEIGFDPAEDTDRAIMATRKEVFPLWGLDPWYD